MRTLILAAAITALSFTANAEDTKQSQCAEIASLAGNIMTLRQVGKPMAEVYKIANGSKLIEAMAVQAYETPRFSTKQAKDEYIGKFKDTWFLACIKNGG